MRKNGLYTSFGGGRGLWRWVAILGLLALIGCHSGSSAKQTAYRIGRDPTWYPVDFDGQETRIAAFSDELTDAIGRAENFDAAFFPLTWELIPVVLRSGRADGVLSALPPLPQYRELYDFSDVYLYIGPVLVVPHQSQANSLEDLKGKIIGVPGGSSAMLLVAKMPGILIRDYMNMGLALEDLARGEIDGVVMPALQAYAYVRDFFSNRLRIATPPLTDAGLRLLVSRGTHPELLRAFNEGLKESHEDGTYDQLQEKWRLNLQMGPAHP
jgi:polar amino acid transport system substrate-binding protein